MMYAKLALENVKKSTKDYLIYIVTLTACISMFYAFPFHFPAIIMIRI